jgi:hypothetical protein
VVMVVPVPVVMVNVVVMMVHHRPRRLVVYRSRSGGRAGGCFLRNCVSGEAERNNSRDHKALDHQELSLLNAPKLLSQNLSEPRMNRLKPSAAFGPPFCLEERNTEIDGGFKRGARLSPTNGRAFKGGDYGQGTCEGRCGQS